MKKYLTLFFLIQFFSGNSQNPKNNPIEIYIGTAVHGPTNREPGTLSLAFQSSYQISKKWFLNFRFDEHVHQFGSRGNWDYNNFLYRNRESYFLGQRSLSLLLNFQFKIYDTNCALGTGIAYYQRRNIIEKLYRFSSDNLYSITQIESAKSLGAAISGSFFLNRWQTGTTVHLIKNKDILRTSNVYASVFLNYRILGNKYNYQKEERPIKSESKLPMLMIEGGIQPMSNLGKYAGAFNIYFEPKFSFKKKFSIGLRLNTKNAAGIGFDKNPTKYSIYFPSDDLPYIQRNWDNKKTMSEVYARIFTGYYYISKDPKNWYFINIGSGLYHRNSYNQVIENESLLTVPMIKNIPHQKNIGGLLGAGFKSGIFKFSLEYNFTGKNIPDYLAAQLGIDAHVLKAKD